MHRFTQPQRISVRTIEQFITAPPGTERFGFLGKGNLESPDNAAGVMPRSVCRRSIAQIFTPPFFSTTGRTTVGRRPFKGYSPVFTVNFAPGVAGNRSATTSFHWLALGDWVSTTPRSRSDTYRVLAGFTWTVGSWDGDGALSAGRNESHADNNRLNIAGVRFCVRHHLVASRDPNVEQLDQQPIQSE